MLEKVGVLFALFAIHVVPGLTIHEEIIACPRTTPNPFATSTVVFEEHCRLSKTVVIGVNEHLRLNGSLAPSFTVIGKGICSNQQGHNRYFRSTIVNSAQCKSMCRSMQTCTGYGVASLDFASTICLIYDAVSSSPPPGFNGSSPSNHLPFNSNNESPEIYFADSAVSDSSNYVCFRKDNNTKLMEGGGLVDIHAANGGAQKLSACAGYNFENAELLIRSKKQLWSTSKCNASVLSGLYASKAISCKESPLKDHCASVCFNMCGLTRKRHFDVSGGGVLSLAHVRLTGGHVPIAGLPQVSHFDTYGGSIRISDRKSKLFTYNTEFSGCRSSSSSVLRECAVKGGAIYARKSATVEVSSSTFEYLAASQAGGAVYLDTSAMLISRATTFSHSQARIGGSAIYIAGRRDTQAIKYAGVHLLGGRNVFNVNVLMPNGLGTSQIVKSHISMATKEDYTWTSNMLNGGLFIDVCPHNTYKPDLDILNDRMDGWELKGGFASSTSDFLGHGADLWSGCPLSCPLGTSTRASDTIDTDYGDFHAASCETECPVGRYKPTRASSDCFPMRILSCPGGYEFDSPSAVDRVSLRGSTEDDGMCKPCAPGKSRLTSQAISTLCSHCPKGYVAPYEGQVSCKACGLGTYADEIGLSKNCKSCPKGRSSGIVAASVCKRCPLGFYNDETNSSECAACPAGTYLAQRGDDSTLSDSVSDCALCEVGKYSSETGRDHACIACETAKSVGMDFCALCNPGFFKNIANNSECVSCPRGKFTDTTDQRICKDCPLAWFSPIQHERNLCLECPRGKVGIKQGSISEFEGCSLCPQGKFSDIDANTGECKNCPSGRYSYRTGNKKEASCILCPAGKWGAYPGQSWESIACKDCGKGRYGRTAGATSSLYCWQCRKGFYQNNPGSTFCIECQPGKIQPFYGKTLCELCPENTYLDTDYSVLGFVLPRVECKNCPVGRKAYSGSAACSVCSPGKHFIEMNATSSEEMGCRACEPGKFQRESGQFQCVHCDIGQVVKQSGALVCNRCVPGEYQSELGQQRCLACPVGFASVLAGSTNCSACPSGKGSNTVRGASCLDCNKGSFNEEETGICRACPSGFYQILQGKSKCDVCPSGWDTQNLEGSQSCARGEGPIPVLPKDCAYMTEYLNNSDPNPYKHSCQPCPLGASCAGHITWAGVRAKYGWWRVQFDRYIGDDNPYRPPDCLVGMGRIEPVCAFSECRFASACLGALNAAKNARSGEENYQGDASGKGMNVNKNESCNEEAGYANFCDDYGGDGEINETVGKNGTTGRRIRCRLCARCLPGYKRSGSSMQCKKCPPQDMNRFLIALGALVSVIGVGILVYSTVHAEGTRGGSTSALKKILLNFYAMVSLAGQLPLKWPRLLVSIFQAFSTVSSGGSSLLIPDCELSTMPPADLFFAKQIAFAIFVPCLVVTSLFCWLFIWCLCGWRYHFSWQRIKSLWCCSVVLLLFCCYPLLARLILSIFRCPAVSTSSMKKALAGMSTDANVETPSLNHYFLQADLQEQCFQGRHATFIGAITVPCIILYILGIPLSALCAIYHHRNRLKEDATVGLRYGLLYTRYTSSRWWWEGVVVVRKLAIVMIDVFAVSVHSVEGVACSTLAVIFLAIIAHLLGRPYSDDTEEGRKHPDERNSDQRLHLAELFALSTVWIILWAGILLYLGQPPVIAILLTVLICLCMATYTLGGSYVFLKAFFLDREQKKKRHIQYQKMRAAGKEKTFVIHESGPIGAIVTDGEYGRSCKISKLREAKGGGIGLAAKVGLKVGDWIVECGGKPIHSRVQLRKILARYGRPIEMVVSRSNRRMSSFEVDDYKPEQITKVVPSSDGENGLSEAAKFRITKLEVENLQKEAERDARSVRMMQEQMKKNSSIRIKARLRARRALSHSNALHKTDVFRDLPSSIISQIISVMEYRDVQEGENVVTQGEPASSFIVLMKGSASVIKDGELIRKFGALDYLGEAALDFGEVAPAVRGATVTANTNLQVLCLSRDRFLELVMDAEESDSVMASHLSSARDRAAQKRKGYTEKDRERRMSKV